MTAPGAARYLGAVLTRDQLTDAMLRECDICVHLHGKLAPGAFDYRPSPGQRSTTELLRYLAACGIGGLRSMTEKNWKRFAEATARLADMPGERFPEEMARQKADIAAHMAGLTEEMLRTHEASVPPGIAMPLGAAIVNGPLKWLTGYKMQLFLYAKASGAPDIGTANAWAGMDWKPPAKAG